MRARIFEPFFTTKEPARAPAWAWRWSSASSSSHGGWIECTSAVGRGTCFDIYLPHTTRPSTEDAQPEEVPARGTETLLLADDEPLIRALGNTFLSHFGYTVLLAEDGAEAVEIYRREQGRVALVIMDMTMPQLSGRDAFRLLRQLKPDVKVIFCSGYSADTLSTAEEAALAAGFVAKPYKPGDLARAVRTALDRERQCQ